MDAGVGVLQQREINNGPNVLYPLTCGDVSDLLWKRSARVGLVQRTRPVSGEAIDTLVIFFRSGEPEPRLVHRQIDNDIAKFVTGTAPAKVGNALYVCALTDGAGAGDSVKVQLEFLEPAAAAGPNGGPPPPQTRRERRFSLTVSSVANPKVEGELFSYDPSDAGFFLSVDGRVMTGAATPGAVPVDSITVHPAISVPNFDTVVLDVVPLLRGKLDASVADAALPMALVLYIPVAEAATLIQRPLSSRISTGNRDVPLPLFASPVVARFPHFRACTGTARLPPSIALMAGAAATAHNLFTPPMAARGGNLGHEQVAAFEFLTDRLVFHAISDTPPSRVTALARAKDECMAVSKFLRNTVASLQGGFFLDDVVFVSSNVGRLANAALTCFQPALARFGAGSDDEPLVLNAQHRRSTAAFLDALEALAKDAKLTASSIPTMPAQMLFPRVRRETASHIGARVGDLCDKLQVGADLTKCLQIQFMRASPLMLQALVHSHTVKTSRPVRARPMIRQSAMQATLRTVFEFRACSSVPIADELQLVPGRLTMRKSAQEQGFTGSRSVPVWKQLNSLAWHELEHGSSDVAPGARDRVGNPRIRNLASALNIGTEFDTDEVSVSTESFDDLSSEMQSLDLSSRLDDAASNFISSVPCEPADGAQSASSGGDYSALVDIDTEASLLIEAGQRISTQNDATLLFVCPFGELGFGGSQRDSPSVSERAVWLSVAVDSRPNSTRDFVAPFEATAFVCLNKPPESNEVEVLNDAALLLLHTGLIPTVRAYSGLLDDTNSIPDADVAEKMLEFVREGTREFASEALKPTVFDKRLRKVETETSILVHAAERIVQSCLLIYAYRRDTTHVVAVDVENLAANDRMRALMYLRLRLAVALARGLLADVVADQFVIAVRADGINQPRSVPPGDESLKIADDFARVLKDTSSRSYAHVELNILATVAAAMVVDRLPP